MSSIGGVGSLSTSQFAQQAQQRAGGPNGKDFAEHMKSAFTEAASQAGVADSDIDELMEKIQSAVEEAKQNGGSRDSIKDAVHGVLEENGVDVEAFDAAMKAQRPRRPEGPPPQGGGEASDEQQSLIALLEQQVTGKGQLVDVAA